jgi:hypothetical protein
MPLDVDRVADALLEGAKALIAKAVAPLRAENADLKALNESLVARVMVLEGQIVPVLATERAMTDADIRALSNDWAAIREKAEAAKALADDLRAAIPAPPDLSALATMESVAQVAREFQASEQMRLDLVKRVDGIESAVSSLPANLPEPPDLSPFVTRDDLAEVRAAIPEVVPPDMSGLATKAELEALRSDIPAPAVAPDLSGLATKAEVEEVRAAIPVMPAPTDLSAFAMKADVTEAIAAIRLPEPRPGAGIAEARQNDDGELIIKLTTGETLNTGKVRGSDGLGFDDLTVDYDGERTIALVFTKGKRVERKEIVLPIPVDRGVWREGETYQRGDAVTWGGNLSIAQRDTTAKPEASDDWRLAVRKGRDGKPGTMPAPRPETVKR